MEKDFQECVGVRNAQCLCERWGQGGACCVWEALGFNCQCFQCSLFYYAIMIMNKSFHLNGVVTPASLYQRASVWRWDPGVILFSGGHTKAFHVSRINSRALIRILYITYKYSVTVCNYLLRNIFKCIHTCEMFLNSLTDDAKGPSDSIRS